MQFIRTKALLLTAILLISHTTAFQVVKLDEDRNQSIKVTLKKLKTIKIEFSNSALSDLSSKEQTLFYTIQSKQLASITLSDSRSPKRNSGITHLVDKNAKETGAFSSGNKLWTKVQETGVLYMIIKNEDVDDESNTVTLNLKMNDAFDISDFSEFKNERYRIFDLRESKRMPIKIRFNPKNQNSLLKLSSLINGKGSLDVFGKVDKDYDGETPTKQDSDFSMMRYDEKIYAHVLDKSNAKKCYSSGYCYIHIVIETKNVEFIGFSANLVNGIENISEYTQIPDHIPGKGSRTYKFSNPKIKDLEVNLSPVEGDAKIYVNPGFLPKNLTKYMYKLEAKANKRILIPKWNFEAMKAKNLTNLDTDNKLIVKPGMVESGELKGNETKQHLMIFENLNNTKHDFNILLHIISGSADLYMKNCESFDSCGLTKKDLKANDTLLFKKSAQKSGIKSIRFPVICNEKGTKTAPKGFGVSKTGNFAIFIKSRNQKGGGKVHYQLAIEDSESDILLVKDHFLRTK